MGTDCQKVSGHYEAILHGKLGPDKAKVWWDGWSRFFDLAKLGLANGQPDSDTKFVTTGFPGINFPENGLCAHQPQDYC